MKDKTILIALLASVSFLILAGCFNSKPSEPKEDLPETIGKWRKGSVYAGYLYAQSAGEKYPNFQVEYSAEISQPVGTLSTNGTQSRIKYTLGIHKNAEAAAQEQAASASHPGTETWKTGALSDRNNQALGTMSICRRRSDGTNSSEKNYVYSLIFSNENRVIKIEPLSATNRELIEFAKALPFNSQADLSMIEGLSSLENLDTLTLVSLSPPRKIAKEPYLKGKTVVVNISGIETDKYIADTGRRAEIVNEMQSLVQLECKKADKIGEYVITKTKIGEMEYEPSKTNEKIPAYGSQCKVTVIDNTIPAIVAEKTFFNKQMPEQKTFYESLDPKLIGKQKIEYVAPYPQEEIKNYITGLPGR